MDRDRHRPRRTISSGIDIAGDPRFERKILRRLWQLAAMLPKVLLESFGHSLLQSLAFSPRQFLHCLMYRRCEMPRHDFHGAASRRHITFSVAYTFLRARQILLPDACNFVTLDRLSLSDLTYISRSFFHASPQGDACSPIRRKHGGAPGLRFSLTG